MPVHPHYKSNWYFYLMGFGVFCVVMSFGLNKDAAHEATIKELNYRLEQEKILTAYEVNEAGRRIYVLTHALTLNVQQRGLDNLSPLRDGMIYDAEHQVLIVGRGQSPIGEGFDDLYFAVEIEGDNGLVMLTPLPHEEPLQQ